jgi:hypothetical protein
MADELALFDLPARDAPAPRSRTGRGRAGETYARTVVADVSVRRMSALHAEALRSFDVSPSIVVDELDIDDDRPDSRAAIARDPIAALGWLLDPVASLWPLIEADAVHLYTVDIDYDTSEASPTRCRLRWKVMVKLRDVAAFRRIAHEANPDPAAAADIDATIAAAWRHAVEPYAPLRAIPGITWRPVEVSVEHVPARRRWA